MMNDNSVVVSFSADASGVGPGVGQVKSEIGGIEPILRELSAQMGRLTEQMAQVGNSGKKMGAGIKAGMKDAEAGTHAETNALGRMIEKMHEGAESVRTFQARAAAFAEVYVAMFAVDKIVEWAKHMAESAEHVQHLSEQFGMSVANVQRLQGVATATGISMDTLTRGMAILDKNAVTAGGSSSSLGNALKSVGVSANDGRTQMERLTQVADKFKDMDNGPKKIALAMLLFGKSGKELIPILNLGKEGLAELIKKTEEYGAVSESANAKGVALAESINESKLAFSGVANVMTDAFAPVLKEITDSLNSVILAFIKSYKEGGIVAVIFQAITNVVEEVGAVLNALGEVFAELWNNVSEICSELMGVITDLFGIKTPNAVMTSKMYLNIFKDAITVTKDATIIAMEVIKGGLLLVIDTLRMFAKIAKDALTLNWGDIDGDWKTGTDRMAADVEHAAGRIKSAMAEAGAAIAAALKGEALPGKKGGGIPTLGGAGGDFNPNLGKTSKPKKEKSGKDDLVQKLNEELEAKKTAWAMAQDAQGTAEAYSLQSEANYWKNILARHNLSAKDRMAIEQKYLAVRAQLNKQQWTLEEDKYKNEVALVEKNEAAKLALAQRHLAVVGKMFGLESTEYAKAKNEIVDLERKAQAQLRELDEMRAANIDKRKMDEIAAADEVAKFRVSMGRETEKQLLIEERAHQVQTYNIERAGLERRKSLVDPTKDPVKYAQLTAEIEALERTHQSKLTKIDQAAYAERTKIMRQGIDTMSKSFGDHISKMITLQEGWKQGLIGIYQSLVGVVANAISEMISKWVMLHLTKLLMGKGETMSEAAKAGAGGVASMAAAPFPLNLTAPAFGASMFAASAAYGAVPAYDVGAWNLSSDHLAMVHSGEMIIPANLAGGMRSLMTAAGNSGVGGGQTTSKSESNEATFHYAPTINHSAMDLKDAVSRDGREMRKWFMNQVRNGALRPAMT